MNGWNVITTTSLAETIALVGERSVGTDYGVSLDSTLRAETEKSVGAVAPAISPMAPNSKRSLETRSRSGKNLPVGRPKRVFDRQKVVELRIQGLSPRQIASKLGVGEGTVHPILRVIAGATR
jgi:DNA-binding NarL/FixJ family response regulator